MGGGGVLQQNLIILTSFCYRKKCLGGYVDRYSATHTPSPYTTRRHTSLILFGNDVKSNFPDDVSILLRDLAQVCLGPWRQPAEVHGGHEVNGHVSHTFTVSVGDGLQQHREGRRAFLDVWVFCAKTSTGKDAEASLEN